MKNKILQIVTENGLALENVPLKFKNDNDVVLAAVSQNGLALKFASYNQRKNKEIIKAAVDENGRAFKYADETLKRNKDFVIEVVSSKGSALEYACEKLRDDKDVFLSALNAGFESGKHFIETGRLYRHYKRELADLEAGLFAIASSKILSNPEIMLEAIKKGVGLDFLDENLMNNKKFVFEAVKSRIDIFEYSTESIKKDKLFILKILNEIDDSGCIVQFIDEKLKSDKELILMALKKGCTFDHVGDVLKHDDGIIEIAVNNNLGNYSVLKYASESLKDNKEFVLTACNSLFGSSLEFVSERLRDDVDVVLSHLNIEDNSNFKFASERLRSDKKFVLRALQNLHFNGNVLKHVSSELKGDKDVVFAAISKNHGGEELEFASNLLRANKEIVLIALKDFGWALEFVNDDLKNDKEVVFTALSAENCSDIDVIFPLIGNKLKSNKEFFIELISKFGSKVLSFVSDEFLTDQEIISLIKNIRNE
jgi:hypothetical protein